VFFLTIGFKQSHICSYHKLRPAEGPFLNHQ